MPTIEGGSLHDAQDLYYKVASNPDVIKRLALVAHGMGFGWCGGTNKKGVGNGFDVSKHGNTYVAQAHYNFEDPYADGYWADKRLKITFSDFRMKVAPGDLHWGVPTSDPASGEPLVATYYPVSNESPTDTATAVCTFNYTTSTTTTHTTSYSFTEGVKLTTGIKVGIPAIVEYSAGFELNFSATQGWSDSSASLESKVQSLSLSAPLPPNTDKYFSLMVRKVDSTVPYTGAAEVTFVAKFDGFLRWGGNAWRGFPRDRPFKSITLGRTGEHYVSTADYLADLYRHRDVPNYSDWDFEYLKTHENAKTLRMWPLLQSDPIKVTLAGNVNIKGAVQTSISASAGTPHNAPVKNLPQVSAAAQAVCKLAMASGDVVGHPNVEMHAASEA